MPARCRARVRGLLSSSGGFRVTLADDVVTLEKGGEKTD